MIDYQGEKTLFVWKLNRSPCAEEAAGSLSLLLIPILIFLQGCQRFGKFFN